MTDIELSDFIISYTATEEITHIRQGSGLRGNLYVRRKRSKIGTLLLEMLNCDIENLEKCMAAQSNIEECDNFMYIVPPDSSAFERIAEQFKFLSVYLRDDWGLAFREIVEGDREKQLPYVLEEVKTIIEKSWTAPQYWNHTFLARFVLPHLIDSDATYKLCVAESAKDRSIFAADLQPPAFLTDSYDELSNLNFEDRIAAAYHFFENDDSNYSPIYSYEDIYPRLEMILYASVIELARRGKVVRKCQNCGKYFIPDKRSDTLYCYNPSPADSSLPCNEYAAKKLSYIRQCATDVSKLSRNILSKRGTIAKRHPESIEFKESYDYFRYNRKLWIEKLNNDPNNDELIELYRKWLQKMNSSKAIPEAKGFVHPK